MQMTILSVHRARSGTHKAAGRTYAYGPRHVLSPDLCVASGVRRRFLPARYTLGGSHRRLACKPASKNSRFDPGTRISAQSADRLPCHIQDHVPFLPPFACRSTGPSSGSGEPHESRQQGTQTSVIQNRTSLPPVLSLSKRRLNTHIAFVFMLEEHKHCAAKHVPRKSAYMPTTASPSSER